MNVEVRGAGPTGWFLIVEGAIAAAAAVLFAGVAVQHAVGYSSSQDDSGVAALVIVVGIAIAIVLAVLAPVVILAGRAVRRGSHGAWTVALVVSAAQVLATALLWPLALPLGIMGAIALVLLLLPETRAECAAPPPVLEDGDSV